MFTQTQRDVDQIARRLDLDYDVLSGLAGSATWKDVLAALRECEAKRDQIKLPMHFVRWRARQLYALGKRREEQESLRDARVEGERTKRRTENAEQLAEHRRMELEFKALSPERVEALRERVLSALSPVIARGLRRKQPRDNVVLRSLIVAAARADEGKTE